MISLKKIKCLALFCGFLLCFIFSPQVRAEESVAAYEALGISPEASGAEILQGYETEKKQNLTVDQRARVEAAYALLSNPEWKKQYDSGDTKNIEIAIPEEERKEWAEMIEPISKDESTRLQKTGKIAVETFNGAITFYIAMGASQAWKCYKTNDPNYCRSYLDGLKEVSGHAGLLLFMGASKASSWGIGKLVSGAPRVASYSGLAIGSLVQDVFSGIVKNQHFQNYWDARNIKDPQQQAKTKKEEWKQLMGETFKSGDWYSGKVPTAAALIAASAAAEASSYIGAKAWYAFQDRKAEKKNCSELMAGLVVEKAAPGFWRKRSSEVGGVLLFLGWSALLHPPAEAAWYAITEDKKLKDMRQQILSKRKFKKEELAELLSANAKLWDHARRNEMKVAQELMSLHAQEIKNFDNTVKKPGMFYTWFASGMKKDANWEAIRDTFYKSYTEPEDIKADIAKYVRSFFCGTNPKGTKTYQNSKSAHGIPIPWNMYEKTSAYFVEDYRKKALCAPNTSPERFQVELKKKDYQGQVRTVKSEFLARTTNDRQDKIDFYEKRIVNEGKIVKTLKNKVLPKFEEQENDLKALREAQQNPIAIKMISDELDQLAEKKKAATDLLRYMRTPANKREAPEIDIAAMLGILDPKKESEWKKEVRYYKSYVIE